MIGQYYYKRCLSRTFRALGEKVEKMVRQVLVDEIFFASAQAESRCILLVFS